MSDAPNTDEDVFPPPPQGEPIPYAPRPHRPVRPRPQLPNLTLTSLGWMILAGVLIDLALRSQVASLSSTLAALILAIPLLGPKVKQNPMAAAFAAGAVVFALWLPLRASTWLTGLNAAAVAGALVAAAATTRPFPLRLNTTTLVTLLSRILQSRFFISVLGVAVAPLRTVRANRLLPIVRGLIIAAIPVAVLAGLLAAADSVFEQYITTDVDPTGFFEHGFLTAFAVTAVAGLIAMTSVQEQEDFIEHRPLGAIEAVVLLASVGGLYAAFAVVQLLGALGRTDDILDELGVTAADYARSGFFQLLWVAGLTLLLLAAVRVFVADGTGALDRAVRGLGAMVALLTTLIVAVAVVRLGLYTDEFGQTTLRWYCTAFAWMLGAAFIAIAVGHLRRAEHLLPISLLGLVAFTLFAVNLLNPEARVAEHNLNRPDAVESLDAEYLSRLSADAWPVLLDNAPLMSNRLYGQADAFDAACYEAEMAAGYGPFGFNLSRARLNCQG